MICTDRFVLQQTQMQTILQPECPVYVHCYRRCTDQKSDTPFVQVRMVNRSDRLICSVFLRIEAVRADGSVAYTLPEIVVADCNAAPHTVFGEERLIVLRRESAQSLNITVERVCFADGMLWRRLPGQHLTTVQEVGWNSCVCTMPNPLTAERCALCGRSLFQDETQPTLSEDPPSEPTPFVPKPAPIVRNFTPTPPPVEKGRSTPMTVFAAILAVLALLSVAAIVYFAV